MFRSTWRMLNLLFFHPALHRAGAGDAPWTDRLIPLPQETRLAGTVNLAASEINWHLNFTGLQVEAIGQILRPLSAATNGRLQVVLHLAEQARGAAPDAILARLHTLPNAGQAYLVYPGDQRAGAGAHHRQHRRRTALRRARTLAQLWRLHADPPPAADAVQAWPLAEILDWPTWPNAASGAMSNVLRPGWRNGKST